MNKETYKAVEMDIVRFGTEDAVVTSGLEPTVTPDPPVYK